MQAPPFSIRLLEQSEFHNLQIQTDESLSLLPASYRENVSDLIASSCNVSACVEKELDIDRLATVHNWLWAAGLPLPPRALHHQILLGRETFVTERMDMHLVWTTGRIFLKPIPRFLLEPGFWVEYLSCQERCECTLSTTDTLCQHPQKQCSRRSLRRRALGFLFSYTALISHESDFRIAQRKLLIPLEVKWPTWCIFVKQLDTKHIRPYVDHRFLHGELRLGRLNKIYALYQTPFRGYMARWQQYSTFFRAYFTFLVSATIYIAVVLDALQVGLTTDLRKNQSFQSVAYGFTVFSILGPLVSVALVSLLFGSIFIWNWIIADSWKKARFSEPGIA
ncbi:hypothetical protein N7456_002883 [Penicillium angulare]|uniref:Uncharacterized protein n=1 Tax=Penicillium angulare TaxID=116970 RepID=A0A9W9FTQ7_9EURO|nr:hypothetical protein N7456_002883 [Penicillium angulare]